MINYNQVLIKLNNIDNRLKLNKESGNKIKVQTFLIQICIEQQYILFINDYKINFYYIILYII